MSDQTVLGLSTRKSQGNDLKISKHERSILQNLARKVLELSSLSAQKEKRELWYKLNSLEETRPVIFCDPENGWNEIITQNKIQCTNELARNWEMHLRKEIFWGEEMGDDRVIEPFFNIPYSYNDTGWGMHDTKVGGHDGGSYTWDAPLKDYSKDLSKLKFPEIIVDYESTKKIKNLAEEIFDGILTVQIKGVWWWTLGMTWPLITLRGLEQYMTDFYLNKLF